MHLADATREAPPAAIDALAGQDLHAVADDVQLIKALPEPDDRIFADLEGLLVFRGPGSFTGLRIGITVMNTIAYGQNIPIVGTNGDDWLDDGVSYLQNEENHQVVLPEYGAEARITKPKK